MTTVATLSVLPCPGSVADDLGAFNLYSVANVAGVPVLPSEPSRSHAGRLYVAGMGGETHETARPFLASVATGATLPHLGEATRTWLADVLAPPPPRTYSELMAAADALCAAEPGHGTPDYRGDPAPAVSYRQQADRLVDEYARRMVGEDVRYCVSGLVSDLIKNAFQRDSVIDEDDAGTLAAREPDADDYRDADDGTNGIAVVETQEDGATFWRWSITDSDGDVSDEGEEDDELDAWREAFEAAGLDRPEGNEIYEHWLVTGWLARRLRDAGESVVDDVAGLTIWGRATTGQAIYMDSVIQRIARDVVAA
jgi:hypothetical protein